MRKILAQGAALSALAMALPAQAEVTDRSEIGFVVVHEKEVTTDPDATYAMLKIPRKWWSPEHSWTGDADNFYMDAQAGGCFCEQIPAAEGASDLQRGSVEHARIVYAHPGTMLRLSGAFGPLQGEALDGTLTIRLTETRSGTLIRFEYVVGGYMRFAVDDIAPAVDMVIGEQLSRLTMALGPVIGATEAPAQSPDFEAMMLEGLEDSSDLEIGDEPDEAESVEETPPEATPDASAPAAAAPLPRKPANDRVRAPGTRGAADEDDDLLDDEDVMFPRAP